METKVKQLDRHHMMVMVAQFRKACSEPSEFIKYAVKSETEPNVWYILLSGFDGNEDEFKYTVTDANGAVRNEYGEYLCRMEAPKDFPFNPPHFYLMTENGVYGHSTQDKDVKICVSIGEFHKDQYRAALGMSGFANQLVSGLVGWRELGSGISILNTTADTKRMLASRSRMFNRTVYPDIMQKIDESFKSYSAKWDPNKITDALKLKLGLNQPSTETTSGEKQ